MEELEAEAALNVHDQPPGQFNLHFCAACQLREAQERMELCKVCEETLQCRAWREQRIIDTHNARVRDDG